jgi:hypothetical protein
MELSGDKQNIQQTFHVQDIVQGAGRDQVKCTRKQKKCRGMLVGSKNY